VAADAATGADAAQVAGAFAGAAAGPDAAQVAGPRDAWSLARWAAGPQGWAAGTVTLTLGAFAAAIVLAPPASAPPGLGLAWLLFVGSSVHVAATGWLYTLPDVREYARQYPVRLVLLPVALILGTAALAAVVSPATLAWCLLPYYAWQFFHFQKQNLGMAALAASSRRIASPRPAERRAMMAAGYAGIAGLVAHPGLLQLRVSAGLGWLYPVTATVFAGAVVAGVAALARRPAADVRFGFCVVYLLSLGFFGPVFVYRSPYAAVGGMTIAHGLQYLLLVGLVAADGRQPAGRATRLAAACTIALAGGIGLSAAAHLHGAAAAGRLAFGAYLGAVMAHFVVDARLWRLRDPFPRAFLASHVPALLPAGRTSAADRSSAPMKHG
jgi:hypothetical protein